MPVRNLRDATVVIADDGGSGGPDNITLALEAGNLQWTESKPVAFIRDRGVLDHARLAPDEPVAFSMTLLFETFLDPNSATITAYEALTGTGAAAGWTSDASSGGDGYAVIIEVTINDPAGGTDEVVTLAEAYIESIEFAEGDESNTLSISGRANITRPAYS